MSGKHESLDAIDRRTVLKSISTAGLAGVGVTGAASAHENEVVFESLADDSFEYEVTVSGEIHRDQWTESSDAIVDGRTARGSCAGGGVDDYLFSGTVEDLDVDGVGKVVVNGEVVANTAKDDDFRELTICSTTERTANFVVEVSGRIERGGKYPTDEVDEVGHDYVEGQVWKGKCDSYRFTGEIEKLDMQGPGDAKVFVDDELIVDTAKEGEREKDDDRLPKVVVVSSPDTNELLNYQFRVTGDLEKLEPNEDRGEAVDEVIDLGDRGTRVRGGVSTGNDKFAFSGKLIPEDVPPEVELDVRRR